MDEIRGLIGIYAAIDQAVVADAEQASLVSLPLPMYGDGAFSGEGAAPGEGAGWSVGFLQWAGEQAEAEGDVSATAIPSLEAALHGLAEITPACRNRARRLLAIAAAARIFFDLHPDLLRAAALGPEYARATETGGSGERLVALFRRDPQTEDQAVARDLWWGVMKESGEIHNAAGLGSPPCTARMTWVTIDGDPEAAVALETSFDTTLPFDQVKRFALEPKRWECFPCWCHMDDLHGQVNGAEQFQETVSFDCKDANMLKLVVNLDFKMVPRPDRVITSYGLSQDQPPGRRLVRVNKGLLEVKQLGPEDGSRVHVYTSKRLKFDGPLDQPGFMSIMCYVGYLTLLEDLLCCAAKGAGESGDEYPDVDFPGLPPIEAGGRASRPAGATTPRSGRLSRTMVDNRSEGAIPSRSPRGADAQEKQQAPGTVPRSGRLCKKMIEQLADAATECIDAGTKDLKTSFRRIEAGNYSADALVQDSAKMWVRMLRDTARLYDIGYGKDEQSGSASES